MTLETMKREPISNVLWKKFDKWAVDELPDVSGHEEISMAKNGRVDKERAF